jgi:hypothetical protein
MDVGAMTSDMISIGTDDAFIEGMIAREAYDTLLKNIRHSMGFCP